MKLKNFFKYLPAFIFCGFILTVMALYFIIPKEEYSALEKRNLADFPELNGETLMSGKFRDDLDTYLSDHLPFRNMFFGLNSDFMLATGRNGSSGVYLGSDGYLFPEPSKGGENLIKNAGFIKEYAEDSDIPVYMTVIPSSGYVNSAKLPLIHKEYNDGQLITDFREALGDSVNFTDVTSTFLGLAGGKQLYYKTDHHWTSEGAYECYRQLGRQMGYEPVDEKEFSKQKVTGFYGTSYAKSGLWFLSPDNMELWSRSTQPADAVTVYIKDGEDEKTGNSYFFKEQLNNDDKYPVFLDGNHSFVRVTNTAAPEGTLIVVKDSYAHTLVPFLSQNYRNIIMVDLRYYKKDVSALAETEKADGVLFLYSIDNLCEDTNLSYLF